MSKFAPDFRINNQANFSDVIHTFEGIVLVFFSDCNNIGTIIELKSLSHEYSNFMDNGWELIGISTDDPNQLTKISEKYSLNFPLLSDIDYSICKLYNTLIDPHRLGYFNLQSKRMTYLIDKNLNIIDVINEVHPKTHGAEISRLILKYTESNNNHHVDVINKEPIFQ